MTTDGAPRDPLAPFRAVYADRLAHALAAKAAGRKVVGYVTTNVPVEMIRAAGMTPVHLTGSPHGPTDRADPWMEDFFDGDLRSLCHDILAGTYDWLDLIVIPRGSEPLLQLYYYLGEIGRLEPDVRIPDLHLLDLLGSPHWRTDRYNRGRLAVFRTRLEALAGRPIAEADLRAEMVRGAEVRNLGRQANALRRADPPALSGTDALSVFAAAEFVPPETVAGWLRDLLAAPPAPTAAGRRPRLMVKGMPQDDTGLYAMIEDMGAAVVADDHMWGERIFDRGDPGPGDALDVLTDQFLCEVATARSFPQSAQDRRMMDIVRVARVEGVVVEVPEWDDTLGWDWPGQRAMLEAAGVPAVLLPFQPYRNPDRSVQRAAVAGLLDRIAAGSRPAGGPRA
jgi:benzoyl-CoA reductase subunit C